MSIYNPARSKHSSAFTLIELLVVIAIIATIAVVLVLILNPVQLLQQSRDSNRLSDMASLNEALGIYLAQGGTTLGSSSIVYVSIPDPTATSTAGDQCQGLGLPSLPATYTYQCASSSTYHMTNGTGWIPINFTGLSVPPLNVLPADPINTSSSRLYYTYDTNGSQYEVTSAMESQKYGVGGSNDVITPDGGILTSVYEKGTATGLEPLDYGDPTLVGYWPLNEGTGTIAYDDSGSNATGSWKGTQTGTSGYYSAGTGSFAQAGAFDGSTNYINLPTSTLNNALTIGTISMWINPNFNGSGLYAFFSRDRHSGTGEVFTFGDNWNSSYDVTSYQGSYGGTSIAHSFSAAWTYISTTYNLNTGAFQLFINGVSVASVISTAGEFSPFESAGGTTWIGQQSGAFGSGRFYSGLMNDVRIYNRILSAAQIAAMYAAGR